MRRFIRKALSYLLGTLLLGLAFAVLGEWFIEVAKDKGLYKNAGDTWDIIMFDVHLIIVSKAFIAAISVLTGLVIGLWADNFFKRSEPVNINSEIDDYRQYGKKIRERAHEMREFLKELQQTHYVEPSGFKHSFEDAVKLSDKRKAAEDKIHSRIDARFGTEIVAFVMALKKYEIDVPFHIGSSFSSRPLAFIKYLSLVGRLMEEGRLEEAQKLDDRYGFDFMNQILRSGS